MEGSRSRGPDTTHEVLSRAYILWETKLETSRVVGDNDVS